VSHPLSREAIADRGTWLGYCIGQGIELTRSRPYRKNDQAWVEQKNGSVVQRRVGGRTIKRYDPPQTPCVSAK